MSPRPYEMGSRRKSTDATRAKILEAARSIIGGKGDLHGFSIDAIAKRAGVARMTVYYQFHSREELMEALADYLAQRGGIQRIREVFLEPDAEKALRLLVEVFTGFWSTDRLTLRRLRALGVVSPSQDKGPRDRDAWRREAVENVLAKFGKKIGSGKSGGPGGVAAILTTLTSFESFDSLCNSGKSPEEVAKLIGDLAVLVVGAK
ncbi:MAG: TetR/AcrR family transcriptional regulator [Thermoplasmata archaeon]|nr:TetR/AcrR family transcriptional regulator [Thermoplasmata archaeon]